MAKASSLLKGILSQTKKTTKQTKPSVPEVAKPTKGSNTSTTVQKGSSSSGSVVKGQTSSSVPSPTATKAVKTSGPAKVTVTQGTVSSGSSAGTTPTTAPRTPAAAPPSGDLAAMIARFKQVKGNYKSYDAFLRDYNKHHGTSFTVNDVRDGMAAPSGTTPSTTPKGGKTATQPKGTYNDMVARWNQLKGTTSMADFLYNYNKNHGTKYTELDVQAGDLKSQLDRQMDLLEADFARQQDFLQQDAGLDDQERDLALQELQTQLDFARQQFALVEETYNSNRAEALRQLPIALRDIADAYAAQGAYYSGRRAEQQSEQEIQTNLAVQAMERAFRGEQLTQEERDALGLLQQGKITLAGRRDDLQTAMDQWNLAHGFEVDKTNLEDRFKTGLQNLQEDAAAAKKAAAAGHMSETQLAAAYEAGVLNVHEFKKGLRGLGYSDQEASTMAKTLNVQLDQANQVAAQKAAKAGLPSDTNIAKGYLNGFYGLSDAVDMLKAKGYTEGAAQVILGNAEIAAAKSDKAKQLNQNDIEALHAAGKISDKDFITGMKNLGYSDSDAKRLLALNKSRKTTQKGVNKGDPKTWPTKVIGGQLVGPSRGLAMGDPTNFIYEHYNTYIDMKNWYQQMKQEHGGQEPKPGEWSDYWFAKFKPKYIATHDIPKDKKTGAPLYADKKEWANDTWNKTDFIAQYSAGLSLVMFRVDYGGEKLYPYSGRKGPQGAIQGR